MFELYKNIKDKRKELKISQEELANAYAESMVNTLKESISNSNNSATNETQVDFDSLSESEYKANCKELWHDDIFFQNQI